MSKMRPIFAGARTAAKLLDMKLHEFNSLVEMGVIPSPILIGGKHARWNMGELENQLKGSGMEETFTW